jgi:hypothetical protein
VNLHEALKAGLDDPVKLKVAEQVAAVLQCQSGNNTITWTLTAQNVPAGFTAAFTNPESCSRRRRRGLTARPGTRPMAA